MPHRKEIQSLYFQCLNCVFENLYEQFNNGISQYDFERIRKYYVSNLHGGIREHILKLAVLKDRNRVKFLLQLINLLIDPSVTYLCTISGHGFLLSDHYAKLISHLKTRRAIGLKSLYVRVLYDRPVEKDQDPVLKANISLYPILKNGLAKNLTVLILGRCCDNEILKIVGEYCVHLTKLDVVASLYVDDDGVKSLCLKNSELTNELKKITDTTELILKLMSVDSECLNSCCSTLSDIRIHETHVSNTGIITLLILVRSLKSFGGFMLHKNVPDILVFLSRLAQRRMVLNFKELYDKHLTEPKLRELPVIVPNITTLWTKSIYLHPALSAFKMLNDVSIYFDNVPYHDNLFCFLSTCGPQLKRITLIDEYGFIDMFRVLRLCSNVIEINGSLTLYDYQQQLIVPTLKKATLQVMDANVISWFFENVPNLEYLEVDASSVNFRTQFDNLVLKNILKSKPACFRTLKYLIIDTIMPVRPFSKKNIMKLIMECERLKLIGELSTWGVPDAIVNYIKKRLKLKNIDVNILYRKEYDENITMDSIRELNTF